MTEQNPFLILKLSSGEEVVCALIDKDNNSFNVSMPLKLMTIPRRTKNGIEESISLSRWMHFADGNNLHIQTHQILASAPASFGLSKFYEYCILKMKRQDEEYDQVASEHYTEEDFANELSEEYEDELELELDDLDTPSKVYH